MRARALQMVDEEEPFLLVGCPPCRPFSSLFDTNASRMNPETRQAIIREGFVHLSFCIQLYNNKLDAGRYFVHEHPWGAWSWKLPNMIALMERDGVKLGKGHLCQQGMFVKEPNGDAKLALKATGWLTNSPYILLEMAKLCTGGHDHASLQNGRAAQAAVYPEKHCYSILAPRLKETIK